MTLRKQNFVQEIACVVLFFLFLFFCDDETKCLTKLWIRCLQAIPGWVGALTTFDMSSSCSGFQMKAPKLFRLLTYTRFLILLVCCRSRREYYVRTISLTRRRFYFWDMNRIYACTLPLIAVITAHIRNPSLAGYVIAVNFPFLLNNLIWIYKQLPLFTFGWIESHVTNLSWFWRYN